MTKRLEKPAHISDEDWLGVDVPEMTDAEFARALPFAQLFPERARDVARETRRPRVVQSKVKVDWALSTDVVEHVRRIGKGASARVEQVLKEAIAKGTL